MAAILLSVIALVVSAAAAVFAYYQARLLKKQIQLQAIVDLDREWRSKEMQLKRSLCWTEAGHPNQDNVEDVLEFLEKISSFEQRQVIPTRLVWDTLGWYVVRYHRYCRNEIEILRDEWTHTHDLTLYQDLEKLSMRLVREEAKTREISEDQVRNELDDPKIRRSFIECERGLIDE